MFLKIDYHLRNRLCTIRKTNPGFTLIEILIVLTLFSVLLGTVGYLFIVSLRAWDSGQLRTGIREDINYAMEKVVRDLKEMAAASLSQYNSISHTIQYDDLAARTYVFYLYNSQDATLDSTYGEALYDLRKADITGGEDPASGEGQLILRDLVSPDASEPATDLTFSGDVVTIDLVVKRAEETVNIRTVVRPRNL